MPMFSTRRVILLSVFATASALSWTYAPRTSGTKITAGAILLLPEHGPGGYQLVGSFKVSSSPSQKTIRSNGTGGACLVADLNRFEIPTMSGQDRKCARNSDCNVGLPEKWSGYCDVEGGNTCWVRPGPDSAELCNKSPFYTPPRVWEQDVDHPSNTTPFDLAKPRYPEEAPVESFSSAYPGPVRWRVAACLNGVDPTTQQYYRGCGVIDTQYEEMRMEVLGPIRTPPPIPAPQP